MKPALFLLMLILLSSQVIAGITIDIDIQESFSEGEKLSFDYSIESDEDARIVYIAHIQCENAPISFLEEREAELNAGKIYRGIYSDFSVDETMDPQQCEASLRMIEPIKKKISETFRIEVPRKAYLIPGAGTQPDEQVIQKIFRLNDMFFVNWKDAEGSGFLISPDGLRMNIGGHGILLDQIGTYRFEYILSKQGYRTFSGSSRFTVIETQVSVNSARVCSVNQNCEPGETHKNCPQDCREDQDKPGGFFSGSSVGKAYSQATEDNSDYTGFLLLTVLILFLGLVYLLLHVFKR